MLGNNDFYSLYVIKLFSCTVIYSIRDLGPLSLTKKNLSIFIERLQLSLNFLVHYSDHT